MKFVKFIVNMPYASMIQSVKDLPTLRQVVVPSTWNAKFATGKFATNTNLLGNSTVSIVTLN